MTSPADVPTRLGPQAAPRTKSATSAPPVDRGRDVMYVEGTIRPRSHEGRRGDAPLAGRAHEPERVERVRDRGALEAEEYERGRGGAELGELSGERGRGRG